MFDYEIVPLDEDTQKTVVKRIFIFGALFTIMLLAGYLISLLPPDTRSEYQQMYDDCVKEEHAQYTVLGSGYYEIYDCGVLLDAFIANGSKIVSTVSDEDGHIIKYVIERAK